MRTDNLASPCELGNESGLPSEPSQVARRHGAGGRISRPSTYRGFRLVNARPALVSCIG